MGSHAPDGPEPFGGPRSLRAHFPRTAGRDVQSSRRDHEDQPRACAPDRVPGQDTSARDLRPQTAGQGAAEAADADRPHRQTRSPRQLIATPASSRHRRYPHRRVLNRTPASRAVLDRSRPRMVQKQDRLLIDDRAIAVGVLGAHAASRK